MLSCNTLLRLHYDANWQAPELTNVNDTFAIKQHPLGRSLLTLPCIGSLS